MPQRYTQRYNESETAAERLRKELEEGTTIPQTNTEIMPPLKLPNPRPVEIPTEPSLSSVDETPAERLRRVYEGIPTREDNQPGFWRSLQANIGGFSAGLQGRENPQAVGQAIRDIPYERALSDYTRERIVPAQKSYDIEREGIEDEYKGVSSNAALMNSIYRGQSLDPELQENIARSKSQGTAEGRLPSVLLTEDYRQQGRRELEGTRQENRMGLEETQQANRLELRKLIERGLDSRRAESAQDAMTRLQLSTEARKKIAESLEEGRNTRAKAGAKKVANTGTRNLALLELISEHPEWSDNIKYEDDQHGLVITPPKVNDPWIGDPDPTAQVESQRIYSDILKAYEAKLNKILGTATEEEEDDDFELLEVE